MIVSVARCISDSLRRYPWVFTIWELLIPLPNCGGENFPWAQLLQLPQITTQSVASWDREGHFIQSFTVHRNYLQLVPGATSALPLHWEDPQEPEDCPLFSELVSNRHIQKGPDLPFKSVEAQMYLCSKLPGSFHVAHVVSHCCCFITLKYCPCLPSAAVMGMAFMGMSGLQHLSALW